MTELEYRYRYCYYAEGYNVPGLRYSIADGNKGILRKANTPEELAQDTIRILEDKDMVTTSILNAIDSSLKHSWDLTANEFEKALVYEDTRFQEQHHMIRG